MYWVEGCVGEGAPSGFKHTLKQMHTRAMNIQSPHTEYMSGTYIHDHTLSSSEIKFKHMHAPTHRLLSDVHMSKKHLYKQNPRNPFIPVQSELTKSMPHGGEIWKKMGKGNYKQQLVGCLVHSCLYSLQTPRLAQWNLQGEKQTLKSDCGGYGCNKLC